MTFPRHALVAALTTASLPDSTGGDLSAFWAAARSEGVLPLITQHVGTGGGIPAAIAQEVRDGEARAALADRDLRRVLEALDARHVRTLVFKGAALAHQYYNRPGLRPRLDADLLIAAGDVALTHSVFRDLGARLVPLVTGNYVMSQFCYERIDEARCVHAYDVHWRIVNPLPFAPAFEFDDLWRGAQPIASLGPAARTPAPSDALLIACVHRAAHHGAGGPLIWLVDVHRLAEHLSPESRTAFVEKACARAVSAVAAGTLLETAALFDGPVTSALASELTQAAARVSEPSARYLVRRSRLSETLGDLLVLSWRGRARLLRELAFPPADYMRNVYGATRRAPLPVLYFQRVLTGAWRWSRRPR